MYKLYNIPFQSIMDFLEEDIIIITAPPQYTPRKNNIIGDIIKNAGVLHELIRRYPTILIESPENLFHLSNFFNDEPTTTIPWVYQHNGNMSHKFIAYYNILPDVNKTPAYSWEINLDAITKTNGEKTTNPLYRNIPLELADNIIKTISKDYVICDPFLKDGTVGVASLNNNHEFIGMETDKTYFDKAEHRLDIANEKII